MTHAPRTRAKAGESLFLPLLPARGFGWLVLFCSALWFESTLSLLAELFEGPRLRCGVSASCRLLLSRGSKSTCVPRVGSPGQPACQSQHAPAPLHLLPSGPQGHPCPTR